MTMESSVRCPICRTKVAISSDEKGSYFPFCSERCKMVDLGQWLGEGYRIPGKSAQEGSPPEDPGDPES